MVIERVVPVIEHFVSEPIEIVITVCFVRCERIECAIMIWVEQERFSDRGASAVSTNGVIKFGDFGIVGQIRKVSGKAVGLIVRQLVESTERIVVVVGEDVVCREFRVETALEVVVIGVGLIRCVMNKIVLSDRCEAT